MNNKYLNHYQLKIARNVLNLGVREIGALLNVNKTTVNNAENGKTRDFFYKNSAALIDFFEKHNIIFPTKYSVLYNDIVSSERTNNSKKISRFQLKASRLLLNLSQNDLAKNLNITASVIIKMEMLKNNQLINPKNPLIINHLLEKFQNSGINFPNEMCVCFKKYMDNTNFN